MADRAVEYRPAGPVAKAFHESTAFVRAIMGPLGSGKSTACVAEILRRAQRQEPGPDGIRRSRWAVIRNSYPELRSTTLRTWTDWCPPEYGKLNYDSPIRHHIKADGLDLEVLFMALDRAEDARKLLSLELTGAWINEAREVPKEVLDALTGRVGRYPSRREGGATWSGILLDTNPPDTESAFYKTFEIDKPEGYELFRQPGGDTPDAENLPNLPTDYYLRLAAGKDEDWLRVYLKAQYGFLREGRPVYPQYRDSVHCASAPLEPSPDLELLIAADLGLTPAAVIGQRMADGRWLILDEICLEDTGTIRFGQMLHAHVAAHYPGFGVGGAWCDPAGGARSQSDEQTPLALLRINTGWKWKLAPSNVFDIRREAVVNALNRLVDGRPGILISPKCSTLRKGFSSGYFFRYVRSSNGAQVHDAPVKNLYSHIHDAAQYLLLAGGESDVMLNKARKPASNRPRVARDVDYDVFNHRDDYDPFEARNDDIFA
jgi:hypothetical protein